MLFSRTNIAMIIACGLTLPATAFPDSFGSGSFSTGFQAFVTTNPNYSQQEVEEKAANVCGEELWADFLAISEYIKKNVKECEAVPSCSAGVTGPLVEGDCFNWRCGTARQGSGWICDGGYYLSASVECSCAPTSMPQEPPVEIKQRRPET